VTAGSALDALVPLRPDGDRAPVYCVHPVSGSAYTYRELAERLPAGQPVFGLEAPGFDDEREPVGSLPALSTLYVAALREFRPAGPYSLLGWSLGGPLAFDMAQRLVSSGARVPALILLDADLPVRAPLPSEPGMVGMFLHDLIRVAGLPLSGLDAVLAGFDPGEDDPGRLLAAVAASGLLPAEADAEFLGYRYAVFRVHLAALYDYEVSGRFPGRLTFVRAAESAPEPMCWDGTASTVDSYVVPGDHHSMWTGGSLLAIAEIVQRTLDRAAAAG
jgi:thioesterase domain-containing protein